MAVLAVLVGGMLGFVSFWLAFLGLGYGFFASMGVYLSVGFLSSLMLIARAALLANETSDGDKSAASPQTALRMPANGLRSSEVLAARSRSRMRVARKTTA